MHQAQLLTPLAEGHTGFFLKQALDSPSTCAALLTNLCQRLCVARVSGEDLRDSYRPWIVEMRELQGDHLHGFELVNQQVDEMPLPADGLLERTKCTRVQDQFAQERRDVNHTAIAGQYAREFWFEVERPHGDHARHDDGVRDSSGNPDGTVRGNDPSGRASSNGHDSTRRVNDLIAIMKMQRHDICGWIVVGERCDVRSAIPGAIEDRTLALLRHRLTQYRKHAEAANPRVEPTQFFVGLR